MRLENFVVVNARRVQDRGGMRRLVEPWLEERERLEAGWQALDMARELDRRNRADWQQLWEKREAEHWRRCSGDGAVAAVQCLWRASRAAGVGCVCVASSWLLVSYL